MASRERVVEFAVKARDEYSKVLDNLEQQQKRISAAAKARGRRELVGTAKNEIDQEIQNYKRLAAEIERYRGVQANAAKTGALSAAEMRELGDTIKLLRDRSREAVVALNQKQSALRLLTTGATSGYAALDKHASSLARDAAESRSAKVASDELAASLRDQARGALSTRDDQTPQVSNRLQAELAARKKAFDSAKTAAAEAKSRFASLQTQTTALGAELASTSAPTAAMIANFEHSRDALQAAKAEMIATQRQLNSLQGVAARGYGAFDRFALSIQRGEIATHGQGIAASETAAQLKKIDTASQSAGAAQSRLKGQMDAATAAIGRQNKASAGRSSGKPAKGEDQEVEIWGLKPWQMTNLGYQVNDVVSGLASGQQPLQVVAQQAGQIVQIWPQMMVALVRGIPIIAATTVVLAPFIAAAMKLKQSGDSIEYFSQRLDLSADGARHSAEALAVTTDRIIEMGLAADDARKLVAGFLGQGIDEKQFEPIARMATRLNDITGEGVVEAAGRITAAFRGNVDDVRDLDREFTFLTAAQLKQIYTMDQAGDRAGALSLAFDVFRMKLAGTVQEATPWSKAVDQMALSWSHLLDAVEDTGLLEQAKKGLDELAKQVELGIKTLERLARLPGRVADGLGINPAPAQRLLELTKQIAEQRDKIETEKALGNEDSLAVDRAKELLAELQQEAVALRDILLVRRANLETIKDSVAQQKEAKQATEAQLSAEADIQRIVDLQLKSIKEDARLQALSNRERFIEKELLDARNKALEVANKLNQEFLGLTKEQTAAIREQAGTAFDQEASRQFVSGGGVDSYVKKTVGVESGGNPNAKNPTSSATGLGQFIEATWLRMFKQYFPDRAESMSKAAILALRTDADVSRQMIELYARENAAILQKAGVAINDASLYLSHFLGPQGAVSVLTAKANTPVSELLSSATIKANRSILEGKTAGEVTGWAQNKMAISDSQVEVNTHLLELDKERLTKSKEYLADYKQRVETQQFELDLISKSARDAAVAKALRDEELRAKKAGVELTREQRAEVERLAATEFDRANVNQEVNRLVEQRALMMERLEIAQNAGDQASISSTVEEIAGVEAQLGTAIEKAIQFWQALGGPGAEQAIMKLQNLQAGIGQAVSNLQTKFLPSAEEINTQLADIGSNAFSAFAQAIANGENAADAFFDALLQGLAEFAIEIGKAIVKQALFNALAGGTSAGGGAGGFLSTAVRGLFGTAHAGGIVGRTSTTTMVNPMVFAGAQRYHTGGIVGLKPNEVPIVALKDEEVLTSDDPRHARNGGGGTAVNLKNVNVFDPADVLEAALGTVAGERILMNFLTRNSRKVSGALQS